VSSSVSPARGGEAAAVAGGGFDVAGVHDGSGPAGAGAQGEQVGGAHGVLGRADDHQHGAGLPGDRRGGGHVREQAGQLDGAAAGGVEQGGGQAELLQVGAGDSSTGHRRDRHGRRDDRRSSSGSHRGRRHRRGGQRLERPRVRLGHHRRRSGGTGRRRHLELVVLADPAGELTHPLQHGGEGLLAGGHPGTGLLDGTRTAGRTRREHRGPGRAVVAGVGRGEQPLQPDRAGRARSALHHTAGAEAAAQQRGLRGAALVRHVDRQLVPLAGEEPRDTAGPDALGAHHPGGGAELGAHVHHELGQISTLKQQSRGHPSPSRPSRSARRRR
jgi:hypothetical protein